MTDDLLEVGTTDPNLEQEDPNRNYLTELVGPGKKFATSEELAKGKWHADMHSRVVEQENKTYRDMLMRFQKENEQRATLEDLITKLQTQQPTQPALGTQPHIPEVEKPFIDPQQIKSLVSNEVAELSKRAREEQNFNVVKDRLTERFGPNFQTVVKSQVEVLGLSNDDVNSLARKSPDAFFNLLGLNAKPQDTLMAPRSTVSTFGSRTPNKRTMSYYDELAKNNPKIYLDKKIQVQMDKDAQDLGEAFFDVE